MMSRIGAQIDFVMTRPDGERLRQFSRTGAELPLVLQATSLFHEGNSAHRLERANQNKTGRGSFHEHIQHPVRAVSEIDVSRPCFISLDEMARARTVERMTGFVVLRKIGFGLNDDSRA